MARLLECQSCGTYTDRLINYHGKDICEECFVEHKTEEARDQFNDESFDWYEIED